MEEPSNESKEMCRLCEKQIDVDLFAQHSSLCLLGSNLGLKVAEIDQGIGDIVEELDSSIYLTSDNYIKDKGKKEILGSHEGRIVRDEDFPLLRKLAKKAHEVLKVTSFSPEALATIQRLEREMSGILRSDMDPYFFELSKSLVQLVEKRVEHYLSTLSACVALEDFKTPELPIMDPPTSPHPPQLEPFVNKTVRESFEFRYTAAIPSLSDFVFLKPLSRGSFGKVFLAKKVRTGDLYAIKVQKKENLIRKKHMHRVEEEHAILARTYNPYIVPLYYSFQTEENLYLVMEYLPGGDCLTLIENIGCMEESVARIYLAEIMLALEYLHNQGIIHRDVKPDNILIAADGHLKLTDFGLSAWADRRFERFQTPSSQGAESPTQSSRREKMYSCVGTPDYLAPEVLAGTGYTESADIWSLGILAYEFMVGIPPFAADDPTEVFKKIVDPAFVVTWPVDLKVSDDAKDLVSLLLQREPEKRPLIKQIKTHKFFDCINWENLKNDPAPFKPVLENPVDTAYFPVDKMSTMASMEKDSNAPQKGHRRFSKERSKYALFAFRNLLHLEDKNFETINKSSSSLGTPKTERSSSDPATPILKSHSDPQLFKEHHM